MKPFNLEEYKKNPSREVVTRDGRKVRIICIDKAGSPSYPIIGLIDNPGGEDIFCYSTDGQYIKTLESAHDIFFAPTKHKGWMNIYKDERGFHGEKIYETEEYAKNASRSIIDCVATIPVEWEE